MKNILIFISIMTMCHIYAEVWNAGGPDWGHQDSEEFHTPWWKSTTTKPTTTTSMTTLRLRKPSKEVVIANCLRGCPVTSEYNPVCGTNNVTYENPGRLECAKRCGVDVQISRRSRCNVEVSKNITRSSIEACVKNCPIPTNFLATCGTNNVTYASPDRLKCVQGCGVAVSLDNYHPCYRYPNHEDSLTAIEYKVCQQACSSNKEIRPICGTDGRDYNNHEHLHCARKCGRNVNIRSENKCSEHPYRTTTRPVVRPSTSKPEVTTKPSIATDIRAVMACMQHCPMTSECMPICGTDGITYRNPGRLLCSQYCGIDVKVKKFASCSLSKPLTNCPGQPNIEEEEEVVTEPPKIPLEICLQSCPVSTIYVPVCGSDGKTYNNVDELICAKNCGVDIWVKKHSACNDNVTPPTSTTTEEYDIDVRFSLVHPEVQEEIITDSGHTLTSMNKRLIHAYPVNMEISSSTTALNPIIAENNLTRTEDSPVSVENNSSITHIDPVIVNNCSATTYINPVTRSVQNCSTAIYKSPVRTENSSYSTENSSINTNSTNNISLEKSPLSTASFIKKVNKLNKSPGKVNKNTAGKDDSQFVSNFPTRKSSFSKRLYFDVE